MPENVCCPSCWSWTEAGARTTCKRCGAPLLLADGRTVDELRAGPPPPPPPPPAFAHPPGALVPAGPAFTGGPAVATFREGTDWVVVARWITIGYGLLTALALIGVGLLLQHISLPITDPNTGITVHQTFNIGPAFAIAAVIIGGVTALFAWLTRYTVARALFLLLDVIGILSVFSGAGSTARSGGFGIVEVISLGVDVVYGAVLAMSLLPRAQPAYA